LDFIAAENSMGFHAPQEAARVLGEAADLARQGQVAVMSWQLKSSSGGAEADQDSDQGADTQE
jgi:nitrite reductase (cytochrome c-552)